MAGFGAEIWVIGAPVSIFVVKNLIEGVVAYLRKVDRVVTIIDALDSELSMIKSGAKDYATQMRAGRSTIEKNSAADKTYAPYVPIGDLGNIVFDELKSELVVLSKRTLHDVIDAYVLDNLLTSTIADFTSQDFRKLAHKRKVAAISKTVDLADETCGKMEKALEKLRQERGARDTFLRTRKWLKITV